MMKDSGLSLLITQTSLSSKLAVTEHDQPGVQVLILDSADLAAEQVSNPDVAINEHNMAYITHLGIHGAAERCRRRARTPFHALPGYG